MKPRTRILTNIMLLGICLLMLRCTNAFKDVQVVVNSGIFKYTLSIKVTGSSDESMDDAVVTLSGRDLSKIFNMNGYKDFKINGGLLTFAVDPNNPPQENEPIAFNVIIKKSGYSSVNIPVLIRLQDSSSMKKVVMVDYKKPPEGVDATTYYLKLKEDRVSKDTTIYVGPGTCTCTTAKATLGFKTGTQFKEVGGNIISNATVVEITTLTVDASSNEALRFFPAGDLTQRSIKLQEGSLAAGTLLPAGLIELTMTANGKQVNSFTAPVQVSIQLNPGYMNPNTHQVVKLGDLLEIYSYNVENGNFQYETTATVVNQGGHLAVSFATDHLTWFMVGGFVAACNANGTAELSFKLKADWLKTGITTPVTILAYCAKDEQLTTGLLIATASSSVKNGDILSFSITPGMPIIIRALDALGNVMYQGRINDPCANSGSRAMEITLAVTTATRNARTAMQLYTRCPNNGEAVRALTTFYLYFNLSGSSDKKYKAFGKVDNEFVRTSSLSVNKKYDFKAA